jgi:hypothetical protein
MLNFSFKELDKLNEQINKTDDIKIKNELIDILIRKINYLNYEVKKFKTDINNEYIKKCKHIMEYEPQDYDRSLSVCKKCGYIEC